MKFKKILEDAGAIAPSVSAPSLGTTTSDIAGYTEPLGLVRRKKVLYDDDELDEGYIHKDILMKNIDIAFYDNGHSSETFRECFDVEALKEEIYNAYAKRAYNSNSPTGLEIYDLNINEEDVTTDEILYSLNKLCLHKHRWKFDGLKQYNTQVVFRCVNTDKTVVIYQHFPRL